MCSNEFRTGFHTGFRTGATFVGLRPRVRRSGRAAFASPVLVTVALATFVLTGCSRDGRDLRPASPDQNASIAVTTTAPIDPPTETLEFAVAGPWRESEDIAAAHTCAGEGTPPPLEFLGIPAGAAALAVHLVELTSPERPLWLLANLAPDSRVLADGIVPADAVAVAVTDADGTPVTDAAGVRTYSAPCPPPGERREYLLSVYALDATIPADVAASNDADVVLGAIEERTYDIAESVFTVTGG